MTDFVEIEYSDLVDNKDLSNEIEKAFGKNGLGIVVVNGVPNVTTVRSNLMPLIHEFANLPEEVKEKYVDEKSFYSFGWSHGKERFKGVYDTAKGSYYANPTVNAPTEDETLKKKYPFYLSENVWPTKEVPDYEKSFLAFGRLLHNTAVMLGKQCDAYVSKKIENYEPAIEKLLQESINHKGRALNYFPLSEEKQKSAKEGNDKPDSWCGWHLDHDLMTGLASAMYINENGEEVKNIDAKAGLYIEDRLGKIHHGTWGPQQVAFQIGESSEILSGGHLRATPHCVRGSSMGGVSRAQFVSFFQPSYNVVLETPKDSKPTSVPKFKNGMNFTEFSEIRLKEYY